MKEILKITNQRKLGNRIHHETKKKYQEREGYPKYISNKDNIYIIEICM